MKSAAEADEAAAHVLDREGHTPAQAVVEAAVAPGGQQAGALAGLALPLLDRSHRHRIGRALAVAGFGCGAHAWARCACGRRGFLAIFQFFISGISRLETQRGIGHEQRTLAFLHTDIDVSRHARQQHLLRVGDIDADVIGDDILLVGRVEPDLLDIADEAAIGEGIDGKFRLLPLADAADIGLGKTGVDAHLGEILGDLDQGRRLEIPHGGRRVTRLEFSCFPDSFPPIPPKRRGSATGKRAPLRPVTPGASPREARGSTGKREKRSRA